MYINKLNHATQVRIPPHIRHGNHSITIHARSSRSTVTKPSRTGRPPMPTIISHAVVPLLLGAAAGRRRISRPLLVAGAIAAMLPDADVLSFKLGIAYADAFGHRGAFHSIAFALLPALLAAVLHKSLRTSAWRAATFVGLSAISHPLLDALTNGGLGVALAWPLDQHRFFSHGVRSRSRRSAHAFSVCVAGR